MAALVHWIGTCRKCGRLVGRSGPTDGHPSLLGGWIHADCGLAAHYGAPLPGEVVQK